MLYGMLIFLHVIVSVTLIVAVLMQSSRGGGLAGTFGGSGITGGVFGGRGAAPFLAKATTVCAVLFMLTSLSLNYVKPSSERDSVLERAIMEERANSTPAVTDQMPISGETPEVSMSDDALDDQTGEAGTSAEGEAEGDTERP